jgi:hypothetical protein
LIDGIIRHIKIGLLLAAIGVLGVFLPGCSAPRTPTDSTTSREFQDPYATQVPIFDQERLQLTSAYSRLHYGRSGYRLSDPQLIVVHYTAIPSLPDTRAFFKPSLLDRQFRQDIASGGDVNVSAHYLVDSDGALYQLAP